MSRSAAVSQWRRVVKQRAVELLGGKCIRCGYSKCFRALQFHHVDPASKKFSIGSGETRAWLSIVKELKKCILLCANCHAEEEQEKFLLTSSKIGIAVHC